MAFDLFSLVGWDLEAEVRKIARAAGAAEADVSQLVTTAKAIAAGVAAGVSAATSAPAPRSSAPTLPTLQSGWQVGTVLSPTASGATVFTAQLASGGTPSVKASAASLFQDAPIVFASGAFGSVASLAVVNGIVQLTLNEALSILPGQGFVVYQRPLGVSVNGAGSVQNTQVYGSGPNSPPPSLSVPASSTTPVSTGYIPFRPAGLFTEHHRGVVKVVSQQGYSYTVTAQLFTQFTTGGTPIATTGALSAVPGGQGFQAFAVFPPSFANQIVFTLTPSQAGASEDTVTLYWVIDGNDTAIDQDPTGAYPVYVGGLDPSGAIKTAQVDADGNWYVTPTSGTAPVEQGTPTDLSGSVTTGGTSQQLAAAKTDRRWLLVQNPSDATAQGISTAESLWVDWVNGEATDGTPSVELTPGATVTLDAGFVATGAVYIIAATTGHKFSAQEG